MLVYIKPSFTTKLNIDVSKCIQERGTVLLIFIARPHKELPKLKFFLTFSISIANNK